MRVSDVLGSYVKAADLQGREITATIKSVELQDFGEDGRKMVMHFENASKALVLNITNTNTIVDVYGDETDYWAGRPIVLYPARAEFRGKMVDAIRVRIPTAAPAAAEQPAIPAQVQPAPDPTAQPAHPLDQPAPIEHGGGLGKVIGDDIPFAPARV